jgi:hypothetical protein
MNRIFKYETPAWGAKLICVVYLLVSVGLLIAFNSFDNWASNSPLILKYVFLIVGSVFLFVSLKPTNWKGSVYFIVDDNGIHFPSSLSSSEEPTCLYVKWENIGSIKRETLYGGVYGVSIELKISHNEIESHFSQVTRANKILGFNQMRGDYYVIAYANNAFQKLSFVVEHILAIKTEGQLHR